MKWPDDFVNKVICGDCLEVMKEIPDKSIDLVLTDPPYGINITNIFNTYGCYPDLGRKPHKYKWDDKRLTMEQWEEIRRISRNQIIFGANFYWEYFYSTKCYLVWDKRGELPSVPFTDTELIWTSFTNKPSKKYLCINHGFIRDSQEFKEQHPTQKPLKLIIDILEDFSKEGELVCDPFLGSGTTAVVCKRLRRKFIGIEINPEYCEIAEERLAQEVLPFKNED